MTKKKKGKKKKKCKIKTHKSTAKRFRISGSGKIMRTKGRQGHFRSRKSKRAKREFVEMLEVKGSSYKWRIKKLAPYLGR
jgi:large subunit ribosomal protein L35